MTRRRNKPSKPGARKLIEVSPERAEQQAEIIRLQRQGATVNMDKRTGQLLSAYRSNVFKILLDAGSITQNHHNAATTLATDWAEWKGLAGSERGPGGQGSAELINDRMIVAGRRVERALASVGPCDRELLKSFMVATVEEDRPMAWRGIVQRVTGVTGRDQQSTAVVMALENLRRHYEDAQDVAPRKLANAMG